jgi:hypothetical protein
MAGHLIVGLSAVTLISTVVRLHFYGEVKTIVEPVFKGEKEVKMTNKLFNKMIETVSWIIVSNPHLRKQITPQHMIRRQITSPTHPMVTIIITARKQKLIDKM